MMGCLRGVRGGPGGTWYMSVDVWVCLSTSGYVCVGALDALAGGIWIALVRAGAVPDRSCKGRSGRGAVGAGVALCPGDVWWSLLDRSCKGRSGPGNGFCSMDWRALGSPGGRPGELPALGGGIWIALVRAGAVKDRSCKGRSGRGGGVALCPGGLGGGCWIALARAGAVRGVDFAVWIGGLLGVLGGAGGVPWRPVCRGWRALGAVRWRFLPCRANASASARASTSVSVSVCAKARVRAGVSVGLAVAGHGWPWLAMAGLMAGLMAGQNGWLAKLMA